MRIENEKILEARLKELAEIVYLQIGITTPFEDLDKSIRIIEQKNRDQYTCISKKMKNLSMLLYLTGVVNVDKLSAIEINKKLDDIYILLNE